MNLLENLSSIVKIKFDLSKLKDIHLFSDNKNEQKIIIDKRSININFAQITPEELPKVLEALNATVKQDGDLLLEKKANSTLQDLKVVGNKPENVALVDFFTGKIKAVDLDILRASLYIKEVHERGQPVGQLRDDLVIRYGSRGRNISNLCTAGYFTSELMPLYQMMEQLPDFTTDKYQEAFNKIVNTFPFAIFVSTYMTRESVLEEVQKKMKMNKGYGINHMNIHGISEVNVSKIQWVLQQISNDLTAPSEIESKRNYITVTICF